MIQQLDDVTIKMFVWKSPIMQEVAGQIIQGALDRGFVWPDEFSFDSIEKTNKNCIGICFRTLAGKLGILQATGQWRKSQRKESGSRKIFGYRLANRSAAETLMNRIGRGYRRQAELNFL